MADNKSIQNKAELCASQGVAPKTAKAQLFTVNKEYAGIVKGAIVESTDKGEIDHMVKEGYWKASK